MASQTTKGDKGQVFSVETVDHRSPAGENQPAVTEKVEVVHETHPLPQEQQAKNGGASEVVANAALSMASTVQSAKDTILGTKTTTTTKEESNK